MTQQQPEKQPAPVRPYGTDTARIIDDYPDFAIFGFPGGACGARVRSASGKSIGSLMTAISLDELADFMDRCRRRMDGA